MREHLQRDVAVKLRVSGAIDLAHAARADLGDDFIRADPRTWRQSHLEVAGIIEDAVAGRVGNQKRRSVYRTAMMGFCECSFQTRRTPETFAPSVISSVIELAESENRSKQ